MAKYRIDETIVDTDRAQQTWKEASDWDGRNRISRATGSQWEHEQLYLSAKGNYYIVHESQWQGSLPHASFVSRQEAARWLLNNEHALPDDLAELLDEVSE